MGITQEAFLPAVHTRIALALKEKTPGRQKAGTGVPDCDSRDATAASMASAVPGPASHRAGVSVGFKRQLSCLFH